MWFARYDDGSWSDDFPSRKDLIDHLDKYCQWFGQIDIFYGNKRGRYEYKGTINL